MNFIRYKCDNVPNGAFLGKADDDQEDGHPPGEDSYWLDLVHQARRNCFLTPQA